MDTFLRIDRFVAVADTENELQIVNISQIVRFHREGPYWKVVLAGGETITLSKCENEKLLDKLPGIKQ